MRILKVYPEIDTISRYNYQINYGVWDAVEGDKVVLEKLSINSLNNYDVVFLPMIKRWRGHKDLFKKIKEHNVKNVLFDNDSDRRDFNDSCYDGLDFVFYRNPDKNGLSPQKQKSHFLMWSINTDLYSPQYGGKGVLFNCSVKSSYRFRQDIHRKIMKVNKKRHKEYIEAIQNSAAAIHTDSLKIPAVMAKILEFASCGTQIISNRTGNMNLYFPDELIVYFDSIEHLKEIISNFQADKKIQKQLREITVEKHDNCVRAKEVLQILEKQL